MNNLTAQIKEEIDIDRPIDKIAWFQGFEAACKLFGIWKNGEQFLGIGEYTTKDVFNSIKSLVVDGKYE